MTLLSLLGISDAIASTGASLQQAPTLSAFLPYMVLIGALFYFMIFRPQNKQAKAQKSLLSDLSKGDEIVTAGGILGKISKITDDYIVLTIAQDTEMSLKKSSVSKVLPKGTIKALIN